MTRRCTVCDHKRRGDIDSILAGRSASYRDIARRFKLTKDSLYRHACEHIPEALALAVKEGKAEQGADLLTEILDLKATAKRLLKATEDTKNYTAASSFIGQVRQCIELLAKLEGKLQDGSTINIQLSGEWIQVQTTILKALGPHPDACNDVVEALAAVKVAS